MRARPWPILWATCTLCAALIAPDGKAKSPKPPLRIPHSLIPQIESSLDEVATELLPVGQILNTSLISTSAASSDVSLAISLVNNTTATDVYAYVTGTASNGSLFFLRPDGNTLYFPASTSSTPEPPAEPIDIKMPGPGQALRVNVPSYISGGRIWFSLHHPLNFAIAPNSQLVTPTATDSSNANYNTTWGFCELAFNSAEVYVNISFVDFVSLSISLMLETMSAGIQKVIGLPHNVDLNLLNNKLKDQAKRDGQPWDQLAVRNAETNDIIRILSPANAVTNNNTLFSGYFDEYNDAVWSMYSSELLQVNTQSQFGNLDGHVGESQTMDFYNPNITGNIPSRIADAALNLTTVAAGVVSSFDKPNASDIFSCSTGPFDTSKLSDIGLSLVPRMAAAFNRGTLIMGRNGTNFTGSVQPNGVPLDKYYPQYGVEYNGKNLSVPMNHYSRIVHELEIDGMGYAFPYDDVVADGGKDVSGALMSAEPKLLTVILGGLESR